MPLTRTDLGDLNLFRAFAKAGGFRKTAADLDLSPSALGPDLRWIVATSPDYLVKAPALAHPDDLARHKCIGLRMGTGRMYHWEPERGDEETVLGLVWAVIVNQTALVLELAEKGAGICYVLENRIAQQLADGRLVNALPDWWSMGPAFHLYYPSRRQLPEALRALLPLMQGRNPR